MKPYQHQELEPLRVAINQRNRRKKFGQVLKDWEINGGRGRDRTYDQSIKSRMLYQLSYASMVCISSSEER